MDAEWIHPEVIAQNRVLPIVSFESPLTVRANHSDGDVPA